MSSFHEIFLHTFSENEHQIPERKAITHGKMGKISPFRLIFRSICTTRVLLELLEYLIAKFSIFKVELILPELETLVDGFMSFSFPGNLRNQY